MAQFKLLGICFSILFTLSFTLVMAQKQGEDAILGEWYNTDRDARIEIYKCGDKYCGKIMWLKEPTEDGKAKTDKNNPNRELRSRQIEGMDILKNFEYQGKNVWEDGTIYDPKNGKTYSCTIKKLEDNALEVRGYVGISLIGRTVTWSRAD